MNKFFTAFEARHINSQDAADYNAANKKKAQTLLARLKSRDVVALLNASAVDTKSLQTALYANEKAISAVCFALNIDSKLKATIEETFRTAMLCAKNNVAMRRSDIEATLLLNKEIAEERKHLIYNDRHKISASVQVNYSINMLEILEIATAINKHEFKINVNAIAQALIDKMQIDMTIAA